MNDEPSGHSPRRWVRLVLRDIHFWIPVAVLIGGLFVLRWIQ